MSPVDDLPPPDPRVEYRQRAEAAETWRVRLDAQEGTLAFARLVGFLAILTVGWLAFGSRALSGWWVLVPIAGFLALVRRFDAVSRRRQDAEKKVAYYRRGLERLDDRWAGAGDPGERFRDPEHPYAEDLDLFGRGSLFERLSLARTHAGQDVLAGWLKAAGEVAAIRARQAAVAELTPKLVLREEMAILGAEVGSVAAFDRLIEWGREPARLRSTALRLAAAVLGLLGLPALFGALFTGLGPLPLFGIVALELALWVPLRGQIDAVLEAVEKRLDDLILLEGLLARLERESFVAPELGQIRRALDTTGRPASRQIETLRRLVATLDARRNMLLAPFSPLLLWGTQIAFAVESWRTRTGPAIGGWLDAIGEFEALSSLAGYAFENPDDPFPELVEHPAPAGAGGSATLLPLYEAEGLGHALLPATKAVRNDVALGDPLRLIVVSGSNMSGKSTLLRAIGLSVVLGLAGGPVRARRLRLAPLAIGSSLRVSDSLQQGRSRFYAEILRLRLVLDQAKGPRPLLFLLDEILAGTNSHDRRLGAQAIVHGLVERGAIGLVTTHDLALAEIADRLGERARNVHFADHLEDGVMTFDYRMQPGVVQHSNALALMRSVGLDV